MKISSPRILQNIILGFVVAGILLLALSGYLGSLTGMVMPPFVMLQSWIAERYQAFASFLTSPRNTAQLRQENAALSANVSRLQAQVLELQQQISEVQVLSALLDFARANPENEYLAAAVIGRDPSPFLHYVIINRGSNDGLRRGMPVTTDQGLVGRVAAVTAGASRVQLITDPEMMINVRLQPSKADAVLTGSLTGEISLGMIPQDANAQPGDLVLTSGLGGDYVPNLLIGQVSSVRQQAYELFQSASVQPVVDFANMGIVLVITNFQPADISPLIPTPVSRGP
jgi:rod shape-determining protein MreC